MESNERRVTLDKNVESQEAPIGVYGGVIPLDCASFGAFFSLVS